MNDRRRSLAHVAVRHLGRMRCLRPAPTMSVAIRSPRPRFGPCGAWHNSNRRRRSRPRRARSSRGRRPRTDRSGQWRMQSCPGHRRRGYPDPRARNTADKLSPTLLVPARTRGACSPRRPFPCDICLDVFSPAWGWAKDALHAKSPQRFRTQRSMVVQPGQVEKQRARVPRVDDAHASVGAPVRAPTVPPRALL